MNDVLTDNVNITEFEQWLEDNPKYKTWQRKFARNLFEKRKQHSTRILIFSELDEDINPAIDKQSQVAESPEKGNSQNTEKLSNVRGQHIRLGLGFLKLEQNQNKTMLNIFLRNSVWKNQHPKDIYDIHNHYFVKQNKLAACWAIETLANLFGVSEKTIRRWRNELVAEGSMKVVKRYNQPDIYIMGEVDEDGNEKYYADEMDKIVH